MYDNVKHITLFGILTIYFLRCDKKYSLTNFYGKKYKSKPLKISNGIPVFFEQSDYTRNYDQISNFHLKSENENPFISEEMWLEMENSTFNLLKNFHLKMPEFLMQELELEEY